MNHILELIICTVVIGVLFATSMIYSAKKTNDLKKNCVTMLQTTVSLIYDLEDRVTDAEKEINDLQQYVVDNLPFTDYDIDVTDKTLYIVDLKDN